MKYTMSADTYILAVDSLKNRMYCTLIGPKIPEIHGFIRDWQHVALFVTNGFTMLVDATIFQRLPLIWLEASARAQKILQREGLLATAEIVNNDAFQEMSRFNLAMVDGFEKQRLFTTRGEAETWLDHVSKERIGA